MPRQPMSVKAIPGLITLIKIDDMISVNSGSANTLERLFIRIRLSPKQAIVSSNTIKISVDRLTVINGAVDQNADRNEYITISQMLGPPRQKFNFLVRG
jgi:hypothetical protein